MSTFKTKFKNFLSRKFLAAVGGIVTGIITVTQGRTVVGASLIAVSVIGYLITEGVIDAKTAASAASTVAAAATAAAAATDDKTVDTAAEIASNVSAALTAEATAGADSASPVPAPSTGLSAS